MKLNIPNEFEVYFNSLLPYGKPTFNDFIIIEKINNLYQDCLSYGGTKKLFKFLIYQVVRTFYDLDKKPLEEAISLIDEILQNAELCKRILNSEPKSEFYSVIKDIIPKYYELKAAINDNKKYLVVLLFERLFDFLKNETLSDYSAASLETECNKRYFYPNNSVKIYQIRMKNKKYKFDNNSSVTYFPRTDFYSMTSYYLTKYFYSMMIDYYNETGYIYRPLPNDASFYKFGSIGVIGYPTIESITMSVKDNEKSYSWTSYEFWAIINSRPAMKPIVDDSELRSLINFKGTLLVAPSAEVNEAFYNYLIRSNGGVHSKEIVQELDSLGFPALVDDTVLETSDYHTFYLNPRKPDQLIVKDLKNYPTLAKIKDKSGKDRDMYIKRLISKYSASFSRNTTFRHDKTYQIAPKSYKDFKELSYDESENNKNPKAWWKD